MKVRGFTLEKGEGLCRGVKIEKFPYDFGKFPNCFDHPPSLPIKTNRFGSMCDSHAC